MRISRHAITRVAMIQYKEGFVKSLFFLYRTKRPVRCAFGIGCRRGLAETIVLGLHVLTRPEVFVADEAVEGWIERIDVGDVGLLRNVQTGQVVDRVDEEATKIFVHQVH